MPKDFGQPSYWENRYVQAKGSTFDWIENYDSLKKVFDDYILKPKYQVVLDEMERLR